ncbi:hypothetical protein FOA52_009868 [Chlamydomonas sp. UWO 241]|nr:hypothetical protein FOA52_009868 [Chlamydomonas sp. UWO 241]
MADAGFPSLSVVLPRYTVLQALGLMTEFLVSHGFTHSADVLAMEADFMGFAATATDGVSRCDLEAHVALCLSAMGASEGEDLVAPLAAVVSTKDDFGHDHAPTPTPDAAFDDTYEQAYAEADEDDDGDDGDVERKAGAEEGPASVLDLLQEPSDVDPALLSSRRNSLAQRGRPFGDEDMADLQRLGSAGVADDGAGGLDAREAGGDADEDGVGGSGAGRTGRERSSRSPSGARRSGSGGSARADEPSGSDDGDGGGRRTRQRRDDPGRDSGRDAGRGIVGSRALGNDDRPRPPGGAPKFLVTSARGASGTPDRASSKPWLHEQLHEQRTTAAGGARDCNGGGGGGGGAQRSASAARDSEPRGGRNAHPPADAYRPREPRGGGGGVKGHSPSGLAPLAKGLYHERDLQRYMQLSARAAASAPPVQPAPQQQPRSYEPMVRVAARTHDNLPALQPPLARTDVREHAPEPRGGRAVHPPAAESRGGGRDVYPPGPRGMRDIHPPADPKARDIHPSSEPRGARLEPRGRTAREPNREPNREPRVRSEGRDVHLPEPRGLRDVHPPSDWGARDRGRSRDTEREPRGSSVGGKRQRDVDM